MTARILAVDDEPDLLELVRLSLSEAGFAVETAASGREALEKLQRTAPDLVVLDLMLPDMSGTEVCRWLRGRPELADLLVLMLTAKSEEVDRVVGFELGADDYVTKPFSFRELVARIRAVVRRTQPESAGVVAEPSAAGHAQQLGPLEIDRRTRRVHLDGDEVHLTAKEFDLLAYLALDPGAVSTRTQILEHVWDAHWYGPTKTVDAHVAALRKKLGAHEWIAAVRGVGFRLEVPA